MGKTTTDSTSLRCKQEPQMEYPRSNLHLDQTEIALDIVRALLVDTSPELAQDVL